AALRQESDRLKRLCVEHAERLHQARRAAVERLGAALQAELSALHLPEARFGTRSEEHTSELQSRENLVCRLLLEKKNTNTTKIQDWKNQFLIFYFNGLID